MKRSISFILVPILLFLFGVTSTVYAEKSTEFVFPEFSVHISDDYLTFTKDNVEDVVGSNTIYNELGDFIDFFALNPDLFLDAVNYQTSDEISIRCIEEPEAVDWNFMFYMGGDFRSMLVDNAKNAFSQNGFECRVATSYQHPQIGFVVIEGYPSEDQRYTILYLTIAEINNKLYSISITGTCSTKEKNKAFADELLRTVNTLKVAGYPDFEKPQQIDPPGQYRSEFQLFDGERFGESFEEVFQNENEICGAEGSIFEPEAWYKFQIPYITYAKEVAYHDITYLNIEDSSKTFLFDEYDVLYSAFYEFRSGHNVGWEGLRNINDFAPAYNIVELYLRDLYGNPHYQYKKGTKAEIDGHGMREAIYFLDGLDNERLYDYSEWIIEDPAGSIKIEHIMYSNELFWEFIYSHNVSVEIIR